MPLDWGQESRVCTKWLCCSPFWTIPYFIFPNFLPPDQKKLMNICHPQWKIQKQSEVSSFHHFCSCQVVLSSHQMFPSSLNVFLLSLISYPSSLSVNSYPYYLSLSDFLPLFSLFLLPSFSPSFVSLLGHTFLTFFFGSFHAHVSHLFYSPHISLSLPSLFFTLLSYIPLLPTFSLFLIVLLSSDSSLPQLLSPISSQSSS